MKVLVVEDHAMIREALVHLIKREIDSSQIIAVGTATEAQKHLHWAERLVLDLSLPDLHGLRFMARVRQEQPRLPIIILTAFDEPAFRRRAAELGASAFLSKDNAAADLVASLCNPILNKNKNGYLLEILSPTERQVLLLLGQGYSNVEAAQKLAIDEKTVYTHRRHLMFKLGLSGAQELLRYATLYYASLD